MSQSTAQATLHPLVWDYPVTDIPQAGLKRDRAFTDAERTLLAANLNLLSIDTATASYRLASIAGGGYHLKGTLTAVLQNACVVTLEPVQQNLTDTFDVEFWPSPKSGADDGGDITILSGADVEPLDDHSIPVGRIVFETFSAAIDPFPRKHGAAFEAPADATKTSASISPFAALAKLKNKD